MRGPAEVFCDLHSQELGASVEEGYAPVLPLVVSDGGQHLMLMIV